jgi:tRNA nucleotidyltransferase (CCA-adding enzyme)
MKIEKILEEEMFKIVPSSEEVEELMEIANNFISSLKKYKLDAQIGGSLAKGTIVKKSGKQDVDIFVVFNYSEDILKLEGILKKIKFSGKLKKVHGSRDYFQIERGKVILEIIPVVKNKDPELAENVTDVSLSHVKYVCSQIKKNPKVSNEIRLAKAFCHAQRCYGAESYIKGFSG